VNWALRWLCIPAKRKHNNEITRRWNRQDIGLSIHRCFLRHRSLWRQM